MVRIANTGFDGTDYGAGPSWFDDIEKLLTLSITTNENHIFKVHITTKGVSVGEDMSKDTSGWHGGAVDVVFCATAFDLSVRCRN